MRIFETANYNFISKRKVGYIISGTLIALSILGIIFKGGLQYGIDFKGGKEFVIEFKSDVVVGDIRSALTETFKSQPEVKNYGSNSVVLIRTDVDQDVNTLKTAINQTLSTKFPDNPGSIEKTDNVTARFSEDLKWSALQAIVASIFTIFFYILIRFRNWRFSAGAVLALMHDVVITLGLFTILNDILPFSLTIDQTIIAAFLTIDPFLYEEGNPVGVKKILALHGLMSGQVRMPLAEGSTGLEKKLEEIIKQVKLSN